MNVPMKDLLFWAPRALTILFALFLSLFALDVFGEGYGFGKTIVALFIHLIPTWLVLATLVISWRWGLVAGSIYGVLGITYVLTMGRGHPSWCVVIAGPLFLLGTLYVVDSLYRTHLRAVQGS